MIRVWCPAPRGLPAQMFSEARTRVGGRLSGILGGASGGLGTFGALHNVCHYTCQILVAGLGIAGITLTGLPLAFLEDPKLIVLFGGMGIVSLGVSMTLHIRGKLWPCRTAGRRGILDGKMVILLSFLLLSGWSVARGGAQMIGAAAPRDDPRHRRRREEGSGVADAEEWAVTFRRHREDT